MISQPVATPAREQVTPVVVRADPSGPREDCDRCPGQALWRVMFASGGELLLCGHHSRKAGFTAEDSHYAYQAEECDGT